MALRAQLAESEAPSAPRRLRFGAGVCSSELLAQILGHQIMDGGAVNIVAGQVSKIGLSSVVGEHALDRQ